MNPISASPRITSISRPATPAAALIARVAPALVRRPAPPPSPLTQPAGLAVVAFGAAVASAAACAAGLGLGLVLGAAGAGVAAAALGVAVYASFQG